MGLADPSVHRSSHDSGLPKLVQCTADCSTTTTSRQNMRKGRKTRGCTCGCLYPAAQRARTPATQPTNTCPCIDADRAGRRRQPWRAVKRHTPGPAAHIHANANARDATCHNRGIGPPKHCHSMQDTRNNHSTGPVLTDPATQHNVLGEPSQCGATVVSQWCRDSTVLCALCNTPWQLPQGVQDTLEQCENAHMACGTCAAPHPRE